MLRLLAPLLAVTAYLEGEHGRALVAPIELFLAPSIQFKDGGRQLDFLRVVRVVSSNIERLRLRHEVHSQLSGQLGVITELFLAQTRRLDAELLGLLPEAVGIEDELTAVKIRLLADRLERLVPFEVLASFVDHEPLLLDQRQRLDPGPLQWVRRPATLHLLHLLVAVGRALLRLDDPVDGKPCLSHLPLTFLAHAVY